MAQAQVMEEDTLSIDIIAQEQGLSQLNALSMILDQDGFLWAGTENGLNKISPFKIKSYLTDREPGKLIDDHIRGMFYEKDTLWLATNTHSLNAYIFKENRFINFDEHLDFKQNPLLKFATCISAFNETDLLVGSMGNLLVFNKRDFSFKIAPFPTAIKNDYATTLIKSYQGDFLIGTNYSGVYRFDIATQKMDSLSFIPALDRFHISSFYRIDTSTLLIGTSKGLYVYNELTQESIAINGLPKIGIHKILPWLNQQILISTADQNYLMNGSTLQPSKIDFKNEVGKLVKVPINAVVKEPSGGIWMGTSGRGIFYHHPNSHKFVSHRIHSKDAPKKEFISIFNFLRDQNDLFMATEYGFAKWNMTSNSYRFYPTNLLEYTLAKDLNGGIWGGGFDQGLVKYNKKKDRFEKIPLPINDQNIIQITPMDQDSIWIHTWSSGIYAMNVHDYGINPKWLGQKYPVRSRTSYIDTSGRIWIGSDEGLYVIENDAVFYTNNLTNERVFSIAEDLHQQIWVGTAKGLNKINPKSKAVTGYIQQEGLPNDFIYGVETDSEGMIWVSTNYGLSQFDPSTEKFKNYTELDGLQNNEFNGKASYKDSLGNLYFGGMNGFNKFKSETIFSNRYLGKTLIEDIQVFGKSLPQNFQHSDTLNFDHNQNVLSFFYTSLNFLHAEKNKFQFKLEGFDKEWRNITQERNTTYTNLNPGTYQFMVKGSNNESRWGTPSHLTIIINQPWYLRTWFKVAFVLFIISLILMALIVKNQRQKRLNKRLQLMVNERTRDLNASLRLSEKQKEDIHFLMKELNHRVKNNLQIISSLIDIEGIIISDPVALKQLEVLQSRIFTVSRIHDILSRKNDISEIQLDLFIKQLIQEILNFTPHQIEVNLNLKPVTFPSAKLSYLGLIINELITNTLKHAYPNNKPDKEIAILLQYNDKEEIILVYRDNGIGFNPEDLPSSNHIGITLIKALTKELGGRLEILRQNGSTFQFIFKSHESL